MNMIAFMNLWTYTGLLRKPFLTMSLAMEGLSKHLPRAQSGVDPVPVLCSFDL